MTDENQEQGVKEGASEAAPPPAEQTQVEAPPPAEENSAPQGQGRVPYNRFSEVVAEKNRERELREQYEARIRELESRQLGHAQTQSKLDQLAFKLKNELQMDEVAARKLAAIQLEAAQEVAKEHTQQLRVASHRQDIEMWTRSLQSKYADYEQVAPAMEKVFANLPPQAQDLAVASQHGLEMLYSYAKNQVAKDAGKSQFDKGVQQGYGNKAMKQAVSSSPSSGAGAGKQPLSPSVIAAMDEKQFSERKAEIDAWVASRSQRR